MIQIDTFQLIILIIIAVGLIYYFWVAASVKRDRRRIIDLLIVGLLIFASSYLEQWLPESFSLNNTQIAGFLIFSYGWIIAIREKFREGLHGNGSLSPPRNLEAQKHRGIRGTVNVKVRE